MNRIDDPAASQTLPVPEAAGSEGYFTEGNPATSLPATPIRASWLNMVQEELAAITIAGQVARAKGVYGQCLRALRRLFSGNATVITVSTVLTLDHLGVVQVNAAAGPITLTLPPTTGLNINNSLSPLLLRLYRLDSSANLVTINAAIGDTINGAASIAIPPVGQLLLDSVGTGTWSVMGSALATNLAVGGSIAASGLTVTGQSPTFITPPPGDNSLRGANTAFVTNGILAAIQNLLGSVVTSVNGRIGAVILSVGDVIAALGFTPVNKSGDSMGPLTVTTLTAGTTYFQSNGPIGTALKDTSQPQDTKIWDWFFGQGVLTLRAVNDAYTAATSVLQFFRTGYTTVSAQFFVPVTFLSPALNDNSGQPVTTSMLRKACFMGRQVSAFGGVGTFAVAIPQNVTGCYFRMIAPGGAGANANINGSTIVQAPGGGEGGYAEGYLDLTGATSITVAFGPPGVASTGANAGNATLTIVGGNSAGQLVLSGGTTGVYASNAVGQGGGLVSNTIPNTSPIFSSSGQSGKVGLGNLYAQSVGGFGGGGRLGTPGAPSIAGSGSGTKGSGGGGGCYGGTSTSGGDGGQGFGEFRWGGA